MTTGPATGRRVRTSTHYPAGSARSRFFDSATVTIKLYRHASNGKWARVDVDWAVSDADGDLDTVTSELVLDGVVKDTETSDVSGSSAADGHGLRERNGQGHTYDVVLTVTDAGGNSTGETKQIAL